MNNERSGAFGFADFFVRCTSGPFSISNMIEIIGLPWSDPGIPRPSQRPIHSPRASEDLAPATGSIAPLPAWSFASAFRADRDPAGFSQLLSR